MVSEETVDKMTSILVEFCERFYGWEASVAKLGKLSAPQLRTICEVTARAYSGSSRPR